MSDWKKTIISADKSIREAISVLDSSIYQIILVVDEQNHLLGTITDGDIRRAILKGLDLEMPLSLVMNKNPIVVSPNEEREKVLHLMRQHHLRQIPVVDENGIVVDLDYVYDMWSDAEDENIAVIMVGGLGTRLKPLTNDCPKPMLEIGGKPILETILCNLKDYNIKHFFFSVNYKADIIQNHFGDGSKWDVKIDYLKESEPMGTAGALSLLDVETKKPILVMNGDILSKVNVKELFNYHRKHNSKATMCVRQYDYKVPYGVITLDDQFSMKEIQEKPSHKFLVNAGIYALEPTALDYIPKNCRYDMTTLFETLKQNDECVQTFPIREYWLDIGQHNDFKKAQNEFDEVFY
ncbi:nucleotidyltransferase family protein [Legionella sp. W05-934-2]|uniref:nucleotidyltransferase family protein n=1 Tax=Legionella sp. W05-934-2 TaxID=1198649 RepID=UPI0034618155